MDELALEVVGPGRWVDDAAVELGEGADAALHRGLVFPVVDASGAGAGFVFVGAVTTTMPVSGGELLVRATVPDAQVDGATWTSSGPLLLGLGRVPAFDAAAATGVPILDDPGDVVFLDAEGREVVVVTDLRPRAALADARQALRHRSLVLAEVGLDPTAMLLREPFRDGEPRRLVELASVEDLGALVSTASAAADIVKPWLTWVVDPTGLVDDAFDGVVGVHGPIDGGRVWRPVGGHRHDGVPAMEALRGAANVIVTRGPGVAVNGDVTVQLVVEAGERGRVLDLWVPETVDLPRGGALAVDSDPMPLLTLPDGTRAQVLDAPFGVRAVDGARLHTFLLPEPLEVGARASLRLHWDEQWDVGGILLVHEFVYWAWDGRPDRWPLCKGVLPEVDQLGQVATGLRVFPTVATGASSYPVTLRGGTSVGGLVVAGGAGGRAVPQEHGTLWVSEGRAPAAFAVGDYTEFRSAPKAGLPGIRVLRHSPVDEDLLVTIRSILRFYDDALPAYPHPEVLVVQGRSRPLLLVDDAVRPEADPKRWTPTFRNLGGGQVELLGVHGVAPPVVLTKSGQQIPPLGQNVASAVSASRPNAATRALAEALAVGWWEDLPWTDRDRWLAAAIPALYRDRFVEEAWGERALADWDRNAEDVFRAEPTRDTLPLVGADEEWTKERGVRLLRVVMDRVGEEPLLRALDSYRAGGDPTLAALVAALDAETGVSFGGFFDLFAVVGLHPKVRSTEAADGTVTFVADPPLGTWDLPVSVGGKLRWVTLVDGVGTLPAGGGRYEIDPRGLLPLRGDAVLRTGSGRASP